MYTFHITAEFRVKVGENHFKSPVTPKGYKVPRLMLGGFTGDFESLEKQMRVLYEDMRCVIANCVKLTIKAYIHNEISATYSHVASYRENTGYIKF